MKKRVRNLDEFKSELGVNKSSLKEPILIGDYYQLWSSLADLRDAADDLWNKPYDNSDLIYFGNLIHDVRSAVSHNEIILGQRDLKNLRRILMVFDDYASGKKNLHQIRRFAEIRGLNRDESPVKEQQADQVLNNWEDRDEYLEIFDHIKRSFRQKFV